ncbi:MAG: hypothetical protein KDB00_22670 [Planctomycetales bacterium]|nr:hypothetical protein [Planctomycetales bacterium]
MKFSLRHLAIFTSAIAVILGAIQWLHRCRSIDASSERVSVNGRQMTLSWDTIDWEPGRSGFSGPHNTYFSATCQADDKDPVTVDQELVVVAYTDYFGIPTFDVHIKVWGSCPTGQTNFNLFPIVDGGGNTDGAVDARFDYDESTRILGMRITQWIHNKHIAKECQLDFVFDGKQFERVELDSTADDPGDDTGD